jgi:hypothetical protein
MQPAKGIHKVFSVAIDETANGDRPLFSLYAVQRPDKKWSLLAVNKDPHRSVRLDVRFKLSPAGRPVTFAGQIDLVQFSRKQYAWHDDTRNGHPTRSLPPSHAVVPASPWYELPPYSITVLRGNVPDS